jgi:integrase
MAVKKIRVHGNVRWRARVVVAGEQKVAYKASRDEARDAEAALRQELKAKSAQAEQQGQRPATLRALLDLYAEHLEFHRKPRETVARARDTARTIGRVLPELLDRPVSAIGDADVFAFVKAREREGKAEVVAGKRTTRRVPLASGSVNRDLTTLRAAIKMVRPEFRLPRGAVAKQDATRVRWLRPEEELIVFETMQQATKPTKRTSSRALPFAAMAKLAALTLMRLSEIRTLRREHVHLEQGVIQLPKAKAGARPVILSGEAQKILLGQLERHEGEWVFPSPDNRPYSRVHVSRVFRKAARAVGLKDFHFHDLRHHGATMALNRGFSAPIVMALGGWKSEAMMRRYAAVTDRTLRAAAEAVSGAEGLVREAANGNR